MDDSDLSGLDLAAAREQIFAYAVDIKRYDREIDETRNERELWLGRAKLAETKGLADLVAAAQAKAESADTKLRALEAEQSELKDRVLRMRRQLPLIRARERSIDPDRLLAELQLMTGELLGPGEAAGEIAGSSSGGQGASGEIPGETGAPTNSVAAEREIAKLEAESAAQSALDALKKRMGDGKETKPDDSTRE